MSTSARPGVPRLSKQANCKKLLELDTSLLNYFFAAHHVDASTGCKLPLHVLNEFRMAVTAVPLANDRIVAARAALDAALSQLNLLEIVAVELAREEDNKNVASGANSKLALHRVLPSMYVSSFHPAADLDLLLRTGISHICVCIDVAPRFPDRLKYLTIPAADASGFDMSQYFDETFRFIDEAIQGGGTVLVHCGAGISRAPTIAAAYIIRKFKTTAAAAVHAIHSVRPCASPNPGFLSQLGRLASQIQKSVASPMENRTPPAVAVSTATAGNKVVVEDAAS